MAPCYLDTVGHDANPLGKKKKDTKGSKYKYFFLKRAKMQKKNGGGTGRATVGEEENL